MQMAMTGSWGVTGVREKPGVEGGANCRENPGGVGGGNMVGVGAHCRAEALGWPSSSRRPQPQCLALAGGHHSALLFIVHTALDGCEGPRSPQGAHLEGAPSTGRGLCPTCSPSHAPVHASNYQLCSGEGLTGGPRTSKSLLPGGMQGGSKVLGDHSPKTEGARPYMAPGCPKPCSGCILRASQA